MVLRLIGGVQRRTGCSVAASIMMDWFVTIAGPSPITSRNPLRDQPQDLSRSFARSDWGGNRVPKSHDIWQFVYFQRDT